jgi:hypothetical protein
MNKTNKNAEIKDIARGLLEGAFDFHLHAGPDAFRPRCGNADEIALQAKRAGMKGIVLKSHDYGTAPLATLIMKATEGLFVGGSVVLNPGVGGMNPDAVDIAGRLGAKILWMPTSHSVAERRRSGFTDGIAILDDRGKILPRVKEVLSVANRYDMALGTGHLLGEEILVLFKASQEMGIRKFFATHAMKVAGLSVSLDMQKALAEAGAFIEHSFGHTLPSMGGIDPREMVRAIRHVGADRCILSSDLGQRDNPSPCDGLLLGIETMLECGLSAEEVHLLVRVNPSRLLNLI